MSWHQSWHSSLCTDFVFDPTRLSLTQVLSLLLFLFLSYFFLDRFKPLVGLNTSTQCRPRPSFRSLLLLWQPRRLSRASRPRAPTPCLDGLW